MDVRIARVIVLMRENLGGELTLGELARAVNLSASRLQQLFKAETRTPPARYLKGLRLERARALLETSFLSVKEIRLQVGARDESHFVRDFRRAYGVTPARYRAERLAAGPAPMARGASAGASRGTPKPAAVESASE